MFAALFRLGGYKGPRARVLGGVDIKIMTDNWMHCISGIAIAFVIIIFMVNNSN